MIQLSETLINIGAAKRLARLITKDKITEDFREHKFFHKHEKLTYLVNCPICVSVYTSAAVVLSRMLTPRASKPILASLALAEVLAQITEFEDQRQALVEDYGPPL